TIPRTPQIFFKDFCFSDSVVKTRRPHFWEKNMKQKNAVLLMSGLVLMGCSNLPPPPPQTQPALNSQHPFYPNTPSQILHKHKQKVPLYSSDLSGFNRILNFPPPPASYTTCFNFRQHC